jgi:phosphogluconate dehydratase
VRDGDVIRLCGHDGELTALDVDLGSRKPAPSPPPPVGTGRELFALLRHHVDMAEQGSSAILMAMEADAEGREK